ncbi:hypothetical protein BaRGS_00004725, partial [Batillaria attramentaria]
LSVIQEAKTESSGTESVKEKQPRRIGNSHPYRRNSRKEEESDFDIATRPSYHQVAPFCRRRDLSIVNNCGSL